MNRLASLLVFLFVWLAFAVPDKMIAADDWTALNGCIGRLTETYERVNHSGLLSKVSQLDRRLYHMLDGIRYAQYNSRLLREVARTHNPLRDKFEPFLISNAFASCEQYEKALLEHLGRFELFLLFFLMSTFSVILYTGYLFYLFLRPPRYQTFKPSKS